MNETMIKPNERIGYRKRKIMEGLRKLLERELEKLEEAAKEGCGFPSGNYFDVLRVARKDLSGEEISKHRRRYHEINSKYWETWKERNKD